MLAALVAVTIGVLLGQWQMRRAAEKMAIEHTLTRRESAPAVALESVLSSVENIEYRRVTLTGHFLSEWPLYLDNRPLKSKAGFYVLMPFKLASSDRIVLVARGWVGRDIADRTKLPPLKTPAGQIELDAIVVKSVGKVMQLGQEEAQFEPRAIMQNITPAVFAARTKLAVEAFFVQQRNDTHDGLLRDWPRPALDIDRHRGYMVTWYSLALMAALFYLVTGFKRNDEVKP
ncbi:MAG: SURF1 family protein [Pseudomonadota bacterium]